MFRSRVHDVDDGTTFLRNIAVRSAPTIPIGANAPTPSKSRNKISRFLLYSRRVVEGVNRNSNFADSEPAATATAVQ